MLGLFGGDLEVTSGGKTMSNLNFGITYYKLTRWSKIRAFMCLEAKAGTFSRIPDLQCVFWPEPFWEWKTPRVSVVSLVHFEVGSGETLEAAFTGLTEEGFGVEKSNVGPDLGPQKVADVSGNTPASGFLPTVFCWHGHDQKVTFVEKLRASNFQSHHETEGRVKERKEEKGKEKKSFEK